LINPIVVGEDCTMLLRDHFRPPLSDACPWEGFNSTWASALVAQLNQQALPRQFRAIPHIHVGSRVEIDVATYQLDRPTGADGNGVAVATWTPLQAQLSSAVDFADRDIFEVQVRDGGRQLVAAVELVSPANKDRPRHRRDFAIKCASYLQQRVALVIVDVVTERQDSLHRELMGLLELPPPLVEAVTTPLYAVAYRVLLRDDDRHQLELWPQALTVGEALPTLPLWIGADLAVPLELDPAYRTTWEMLRLDD
jgi:hypothetical protein